MSSLSELRREYASRALTEADADADPVRQFTLWFEEALKSQLIDVNAMTLATVDAVSNTPDIQIKAVAQQFQWTFQYLDANGKNCGACGNQCTAGSICVDAICVAGANCTGGRLLCDGGCVDARALECGSLCRRRVSHHA